jgi:hypothetical protein
MSQLDPGSLSPVGRSGAGVLSGADDPVTAATGAVTTRLMPLTALLTARLTRLGFFLATFFLVAVFLAAVFLAGLAFAARFERTVFLAGLFAERFERLGAFFAFFAAFFLATRLAI